MRTKEVEEAIKILDKYKIRLLQTRKEIGLVEDFKNHHTEKQYNRCGKRANAIDTVLSYIETLEKLPNKIRDKIKELEEDIEESKRMIKNATEEDEKKWWQEELIKLVTGKLYLEEIIGE